MLPLYEVIFSSIVTYGNPTLPCLVRANDGFLSKAAPRKDNYDMMTDGLPAEV